MYSILISFIIRTTPLAFFGFIHPEYRRAAAVIALESNLVRYSSDYYFFAGIIYESFGYFIIVYQTVNDSQRSGISDSGFFGNDINVGNFIRKNKILA